MCCLCITFMFPYYITIQVHYTYTVLVDLYTYAPPTVLSLYLKSKSYILYHRDGAWSTNYCGRATTLLYNKITTLYILLYTLLYYY